MRIANVKHRAGTVGTLLFLGVFLASVWIAASPASANFIGFVEVTATNEHGSAHARFDPFNPQSHVPDHAQVPDHAGMPDRIREKLAEKFALKDKGKTIAVIDELIIDMDGDPVVELTFGATAGDADTTFSIWSTVVGFDPLTDPIGEAFVTGTLTDTGNDGASLNSPSGLFQAKYNGDILFGGAGMVGGTVAGPGGIPGPIGQSFGPMTIDGDVNSIQGIVQFTLSADDMVTGIGRFEVTPIPEPSTLVLLGMAAVGLLICARRRKK